MRIQRFLLAALAILTVTSISAGVPTSDDEGFIALFDGKDLSRWIVPEGDNGHWKIVDGVIDYDALSEAKAEKHLFTEKEYGTSCSRWTGG